MKLNSWYQQRGMRFILGRASQLARRYRLGPRQAMDRIQHCLHELQAFGCAPTLAVPGMVVQGHPAFIQSLQAEGAEIAVHGYNHVDMKSYPPEESSGQLARAVTAFREHHLDVHGFRCPYLSASDGLLKALPPGLFEYSSNKAVLWPVAGSDGHANNLLFDTLRGFYQPAPVETSPCLPSIEDGLVEIPVCVPDDLQLHDGLLFGLDQFAELWGQVLTETYRRGELFTLMFHPELASFCEAPFTVILRKAAALHPGVWVAQLREISTWWRERAGYKAQVKPVEGGYDLQFSCSERATLVCRGLGADVPVEEWDSDYGLLVTRRLYHPGPKLPFIGLAPGVPGWVRRDLQAMGYLVEAGELSSQCSLYLDDGCLKDFSNPVALRGFIEHSPEPLIRYWPWPDGNRSALSITGDLDALSIVDYARRLIG